MAYVIYVNPSRSRVRVHDTNCTYYQNRKADKTPNGYWKVFKNLQQASTYAKNTGESDVKRDRCV